MLNPVNVVLECSSFSGVESEGSMFDPRKGALGFFPRIPETTSKNS